MQVLVTGGSGWIGTHLCRLIVSEGHDVFRYYSARRFDACIHLAWYVQPPDYLTSEKNVQCLSDSLTLFAALAGSGCRRFVGVGTCLEYIPSEAPLSEASPIGPVALYATCKDAFRRVAEVQARMHAVSFAWARIFQPYGPGEHEARLVPTVVRKLLAGEPCELSSGAQVRDFLHVRDVARALWTVACSKHEGAVNVGSGWGVAVAEVARQLANIVDKKRVSLLHFGAQADEPPRVVADTQLLRSLGWAPTYELRTGLADVVQAARMA